MTQPNQCATQSDVLLSQHVYLVGEPSQLCLVEPFARQLPLVEPCLLAELALIAVVTVKRICQLF